MSTTETPSTDLATSRYRQPLLWALLVTIAFIFALWGFFQPYPVNLILWAIAAISFILFLITFFRNLIRSPKIEVSEVRRLIVCEQCNVETEGPYEKGDHVFRSVGKCPRCNGSLYIKAVYSIDAKTPLKRQEAKGEETSSESEA